MGRASEFLTLTIVVMLYVLAVPQLVRRSRSVPLHPVSTVRLYESVVRRLVHRKRGVTGWSILVGSLTNATSECPSRRRPQPPPPPPTINHHAHAHGHPRTRQHPLRPAHNNTHTTLFVRASKLSQHALELLWSSDLFSSGLHAAETAGATASQTAAR